MTALAIELIPLAQEVACTEDELIVLLADGRTIKAPLIWFPRLLGATPKQRNKWEFLGDGEGIHWPDLDEDISVLGILVGKSAEKKKHKKKSTLSSTSFHKTKKKTLSSRR